MKSPFRIASFNVHHCEGRDGRVDVGRIAGVLRGLSADLVVLQELDVGLERSRSADQPAELSRHLDLPVEFFPTLQRGSGHYGIGVAGRGSWSSEVLPRVAREEPRAVVIGSWNDIRIVTAHLSRNEMARILQTQRLAEIVAEERGPVVLLGDLNQPARDLGPLEGAGLTALKPRRPLMSRLRPIYQVDHILVSDHFRPLEVRTIRTDASDHDPLVAALEVRGSRVEGNALG